MIFIVCSCRFLPPDYYETMDIFHQQISPMLTSPPTKIAYPGLLPRLDSDEDEAATKAA